MKNLPLIGFALVMFAGLFFIAGGPMANIIPQGTANFLGITCGVLGTICWVAYGMSRKSSDQQESAE